MDKTPRKPTKEELEKLLEASAASEDEEDVEQAKIHIEEAYISVFDKYQSESPGHTGKIISVIWAAGPTFYEVYIEEDGKLVRQDCEV